MDTELSHYVVPVTSTRKRKGSGEDETGVSRKMRCYLGDKIKDEEPCLSLKIRSYPGDNIGEKTCPSLRIRSNPEDSIDDDKPCPSRKMRCHSRERSNDRTEKHNFNIRGYPGDNIDDDEPCSSRKMRCHSRERSKGRREDFNIRNYHGDKFDHDETCLSREMRCHARDRRKSRPDIHKLDEDFEFELSCYDNETKPSNENTGVQGNAQFALYKDFTVSAGSALTSCNIKSTISADVEKMVSEGDGKVLAKKEAAKVDESPQQAEYVYRLLRDDELYKEGLRPKNIESKASLHQHVAGGSKGLHSRFISCCYTLHALHRLARLTKHPSLIREVVRINVTKLNNEEVKVIKLFIEDVREKHIILRSKAWGFAENFQEVILEPKTHVPADCIERIGIVKDNTFTKDEHITL